MMKFKNEMTVRELMELLSKCNPDSLVRVKGGENCEGEWAYLDADDADEFLMEYEG